MPDDSKYVVQSRKFVIDDYNVHIFDLHLRLPQAKSSWIVTVDNIYIQMSMNMIIIGRNLLFELLFVRRYTLSLKFHTDSSDQRSEFVTGKYAMQSHLSSSAFSSRIVATFESNFCGDCTGKDVWTGGSGANVARSEQCI